VYGEVRAMHSMHNCTGPQAARAASWLSSRSQMQDGGGQTGLFYRVHDPCEATSRARHDHTWPMKHVYTQHAGLRPG
jgi:hypothetical protein